MPEPVRAGGEEVKVIQNLKTDKITVWDSGSGNSLLEGKGARGTTADFLSALIGSLPPVHELATLAGIDLRGAFGKGREEPDNGAAA